MLDKRSAIDGCVADLAMAQKTLYQISNGQGASEEQIHKAAIHAKRLELKLALAKLGQAEYYLSSLSARVDYLEARLSRDDGCHAPWWSVWKISPSGPKHRPFGVRRPPAR